LPGVDPVNRDYLFTVYSWLIYGNGVLERRSKESSESIKISQNISDFQGALKEKLYRSSTQQLHVLPSEN
jgi:hypothetical protein